MKRPINPQRYPHAITRRRQGPPSRNYFNELVPGPIVETALRASVQPVRLQDVPTEGGQQYQGHLLAFVPDGQIPGETGAALAGAFDGSLADRVVYDGLEYAVDVSKHWEGKHTEATLQRES